MMTIFAEYIWIDGTYPTRKLRSKTKVMHDEDLEPSLDSFPNWVFDGSSTNQADGDDSDCILKPVAFSPDPIRGDGCYLVLCEVFSANGEPHPTNSRAKLRAVLDQGADALDSWFGYEQEYTLYEGSRPLGFPSERRFPGAQGPYYCGVGADEVYGRDLVEVHMAACIDAGLLLTGINAEVMPGQWEFQVGGPGGGPLKASDHLWIARWLLYRLGEEIGISATLDPKPVPGDWNGAGMHTNFSTQAMRTAIKDVGPFTLGDSDGDGQYDQFADSETEFGLDAIKSAIEKIGRKIDEHLAAYGAGYEMRLTGHHETCRYDEFKYGISDRTASIRIPANVARNGYGYLEDRRPNANADPYDVAARILMTVCELD
jgi:glutamine synthetase